MGFSKRGSRVVIPRWWRNRIRGPLSPQQIHQMIICVQSNSHRTTSECWWRTQMPRKANQSPQNEVWCVLVTQSCLTLCIPMDCSPPGSSVCGILQARILEWVAIPFSRGSSQPRNQPGGLLHCRQILYQLSYQ